jgi:putative sporulation protein YyaC
MNLKEKFIQKKPDYLKVHYDNDNTSEVIGRALFNLLQKQKAKNVTIVCIGTDRSTGDALGPIVGTKLKEMNTFPYHLYGTLEEPIHAVNLEENYENIRRTHKDSTIIAIDACLGRFKSIGYISLGKGSIKPGAGVHKTLPSVGDIYINGIVNVSGMMEYFVLQNTRLHLVMKMATVIANGISIACEDYKRNNHHSS